MIDPTSNTARWNIDASVAPTVLQLLHTLVEFAQGCPDNQSTLASSKMCIAVSNLIGQDYGIKSMKSNAKAEKSVGNDYESALANQINSTDSINGNEPILSESADSGFLAVDGFTVLEIKKMSILLLYSLLEGNHSTKVAESIMQHTDWTVISSHLLDLVRGIENRGGGL